MESQILLLIVSIAISALIGFVLSTKNDVRTVVRDSVLGGVMGFILTSVISLNYEIHEFVGIRNNIMRPNNLSKLERKIERENNNAVIYESIKIKKKKIDDELELLISGNINLSDESEVIDEWQRLFNGSSTSVEALNYVDPDYWLTGSKFSSIQLNIQKNAINKGVNIKRIFIYNKENSQEINTLNIIGNKLSDSGISVRYCEYHKIIESSVYQKNKAIIKGAMDYVIYDLNTMLLTFQNNEDKKIINGLITSDRLQIDTAKNLFNELWVLSTDKI